jgi:DNA repair exonuclease SbcCD ATPase subunit
MLIPRLKLTNFGQHQSLELKMPPGIIGLIGPTGSGKSTILKSIEFAITGNLSSKETAESFVFRRGTDTPANGSAEMDIIKHGRLGTLFRQIGKTPKRTLKWADSEDKVTKSGDIDRILEEVFGADKKAISSIVFLPQGAIGKMLFADKAERELIFQRLLLIGYMPPIEAAATAQVKLLESTIQDYSVVLDELRAQRKAAETEHKLAVSQIPEFDNGAYHAFLTLKDAISNRTRIRADEVTARAKHNRILIENRSLLITKERELFVLESEPSISVPDVPDKASWIGQQREAARVEAARLASNLTDAENDADILARHKSLTEKRDAAKREKENYETQIGSIPFNVAGMLVARKKLRETLAARDNAKTEASSARSALGALLGKSPEIEEHKRGREDAETKGLTLNSKLSFLAGQISFLRVLEKGHREDSACPFCNTENPDASKFPKLEILLDEQDKLETELSNSRTIWSQHNTTIAAFESSLASARTLEKQSYEVFDKASDAYTAAQQSPEPGFMNYEEAQLETWVAEKHRLCTLLAIPTKTITDTELELASLAGQLPKDKPAVVDIPKLRLVANTAREKWQAWHDFATLWNILQGDIGRCREAIRTADADFAVASNAVMTADDSWLAARKNLPDGIIPHDIPMEDVEKRIGEYEAARTLRVQAQAKADQVNAQLNGILIRMTEIDKAMEQQETTRQIINELSTLAKTFARAGLPSTYLNDRFQRTMKLTNTNLRAMGSEFTVRASGEEPLAFDFLRHDRDDAVWMEQEKLSGGQRMKLAVAFLLGLQSTTIPDVGLLVMDEPSTHLDPDCVDELRELLTVMGPQFAAREAQIIVCDHNPRLIPFDVHVIDLAKIAA